VTGGASGIGAATCRRLAAEGARVAVTDVNIEGAHEVAGEIDGAAFELDVRSTDSVKAAVEGAEGELGPVDILVNNAAITFPGDLDLPPKRFDLVMQVDLRAPYLAMLAVLPGMKERGTGAIVNISSVAALNYFPGLMAYGMAKSALEHLTMSAAHQLRPYGIAVNTFRIDVPVASEGFLANLPGADTSDWEPPEVAAEGIVWMLEQPPGYTGHNAGMAELREMHGIMPSRAQRVHRQGSGVVTRTHFRPPA
jgi:NAD(P)-dependent dehydrogenase (short-subunit alcohol dehydrogenase family)